MHRVPNEQHTFSPSSGGYIMKRILMAIIAVAVAVTFSAPAFAEEKKEEKKGGKFIEQTYGEKKEEKKGGK
jgi:uncharacterized protein YxeA